MSPISAFFRLSLIAAMLAGIGEAKALGLGEIRTRSYLGEGFAAEVDVFASGGEQLDASCFRLRPASGEGDLPWLKRGSFRLRKGPRPVLELRSEQPTREPILQVGIHVACGHEIRRDYTVLLSPRNEMAELPVQEEVPLAPPPIPRRQAAAPRMPVDAVPQVPAVPVPIPRPPKPARQRFLQMDRLVISGGGEAPVAVEPSLRLATELSLRDASPAAMQEKDRDILRLEYRLLMALNEQAASQLAAAEKMRRVGVSLTELQARVEGTPSSAVSSGGEPSPAGAEKPAVLPVSAPTPQPQAAQATAAVQPEPVPARTSFLTEWTLYGGILTAVLATAGWLGWRQRRERSEAKDDFSNFRVDLEPVVDPPRDGEVENFKTEAKPRAGEAGSRNPAPVDEGVAVPADNEVKQKDEMDSSFSVGSPIVDEHFEVNPVMELAEIMLSFGRVKGAAQALQEFVDNNPQEALQPWIRLLDVYRMAGMREEFERLARNLNQYFNVEVQQWAADGSSVPSLESHGLLEHELSLVAKPKAASLEDMEHICKKLVESWGTPDCGDYLHHLLRDNRGGQRSGFPLSVVEEILFLIELDETKTSMKSGEIVKGEKK